VGKETSVCSLIGQQLPVERVAQFAQEPTFVELFASVTSVQR